MGVFTFICRLSIKDDRDIEDSCAACTAVAYKSHARPTRKLTLDLSPFLTLNVNRMIFMKYSIRRESPLAGL